MISQRLFSTFFAILFIFIFTSATTVHAKTYKIAVIEMQQIVKGCKAGKKAMRQLQVKYQKLQKKLNEQAKKIQQFKENILKNSSILTQQAKKEKEKEYEQMVQKIQAEQQNAQMEMRQAEQAALKPIFKQLKQLLTKIGKEKGYALILEGNMPGVYYTSSRIDITKMVIKKLDAVMSKSSKKSHKKGK